MKHKYEPLDLHLRSLGRSLREVTLSFRDLERVLGAVLPPSAKTYRAWWGNQQNVKNRPQAAAWMSTAFRVDAVHPVTAGGWVRFERVGPSVSESR